MTRPLRLGVIGLGRAFTLMLPTFLADPRIRLSAAFDPRAEAVARFAAEFGGTAFGSAEALCATRDIDAVYVASPHQFHRVHVECAARAGKHVMVEKPMALGIEDALAMIEAARAARIFLLVGHSHSFDRPYLRSRDMILSGAFGRLRMVTALNFTDFLYRPRRAEELDTARGGGVVFSQAAHQVDVARLLACSSATTLVAQTGHWDEARPTEGAYAAHIRFASGAVANLTYSGYGHFDTDEFADWWSELGQKRDPVSYGAARRALAGATTPEAEEALKTKRGYGPSGVDAFRLGGEIAHNHFGLVIASCERADLRPGPRGVAVYADDERRFEALPAPVVPRAEVIDELYAAVIEGKSPLHSGEWGLATLEACLAIRSSAKTGRVETLRHQI